jgi:hypothetical protein
MAADTESRFQAKRNACRVPCVARKSAVVRAGFGERAGAVEPDGSGAASTCPERPSVARNQQNWLVAMIRGEAPAALMPVVRVTASRVSESCCARDGGAPSPHHVRDRIDEEHRAWPHEQGCAAGLLCNSGSARRDRHRVRVDLLARAGSCLDEMAHPPHRWIGSRRPYCGRQDPGRHAAVQAPRKRALMAPKGEQKIDRLRAQHALRVGEPGNRDIHEIGTTISGQTHESRCTFHGIARFIANELLVSRTLLFTPHLISRNCSTRRLISAIASISWEILLCTADPGCSL